ncbi:MAG: hypothetical protein CME26_02490 [Gemmatimonadetes bacterium]|nr:hypothetical protein [Gemmatimonadota bacterium]|tara:strand:- start:3195 stop:4004 length:810 start_codon:yes stop_codon:yes gene_type:complete
MTLHIEPSDTTIGARILDLPLHRPLDEVEQAAVEKAIYDHSVIVFPDQQISQADLVRFTNYFGIAVPHVRKQLDNRELEEIFIVSNVKENGEPIGALGNAELTFHSDLSYLHEPGTLSILYAIEIPAEGGDTHWCDCYAAYDGLSDEMKHRLVKLRAVHRHYVEGQNPETPASHPVVCTHPATGRKALYVGPHLTKYIEGVSDAESEDLLSRLYEHALRPEYVYRHRWGVGDLVVFDNRCTMHRRDPFPDEQRRVMWRTQIFNDVSPVP